MSSPDRALFSIGGLDPRSLAERFGTPLFVYDAEAIRTAYRAMRDAFEYMPTRVHYAAVCNPNLHLLRLLRAEGAGLHANSPGDVFCGLRAGFAPEDIVFSGSNLGDEDLDYLIEANVHLNLDSLDDLRRALERGSGRSFGLRVHLEQALPESRMGLRVSELDQARKAAWAAGSRITALHVYCGTHGRHVDRYRAALALLVELAECFPDIDCLNLGGGFGYDYHERQSFPFGELAAVAEVTLKKLSLRLGRTITLRVEPGRALVAAAGVLLTRVRSTKMGAGRRYVGVDTTTAHFTSPAVHGAHRHVVPVTARSAIAEASDVCGNTTYSRDFIAQNVVLPAVRAGDLLAILDAGAYGYCMGGRFLNRPRPAEIFVDGGEAKLVTRRESFEDLISLQMDA